MKSSRHLLLVGAVALLSLALTVSILSTTSSWSATVSKFDCQDKLGCIAVSPDEPIHIAYALSTSGVDANVGIDSKYGADLAVDDAGGRILGHDVQFDGQDSCCTEQGGRFAASRIASDKTIVAVVGMSCSNEVLAGQSILLTNAGLSMVSPTASAPILTDPTKHVPGFFRTFQSDNYQALVAAEFVATYLKATKVACIQDNSPYAKGLVNAFGQALERLGGTITSVEVVNSGIKDMKPLLRQVATTKPDVLYFPIFADNAEAIVSQVRDVPGLETTALIVADALFYPDFVQDCGPNAVGMYFTAPNFTAFSDAYQDLIVKYRQKFNVQAPVAPMHAYAYDAMSIILAALERPGVTIRDAENTLHIQKQSLRDAIASTTDLKGITGNLTCRDNGDCSAAEPAIYQVASTDFVNRTMPEKPIWAPDRGNRQTQ